jgi:hemerythrin superfamily protein
MTMTDLRAGEALRRDHARLDRLYAELLDAYHEEKWSLVDEAWGPFESGLRAHMAAEETHVFPGLDELEPGEVAALRVEHAELRKLLGELGVAVELHAVRENVARALVDRLHAHAAREDRIVYRWADEKLRPGTLVALSAV